MKGWDKFYDGVRYIFRNGVMKIRYEFCDGTVKEETPGAEYEAAYQGAIRAELRNNAKEWYYRYQPPLGDANENDGDIEAIGLNPEDICIASAESRERKKKLVAVLKTLTPEQSCLVEMLRQGVSVTEIAKKLGVGKTAVSNMRARIQKKIAKILK